MSMTQITIVKLCMQEGFHSVNIHLETLLRPCLAKARQQNPSQEEGLQGTAVARGRQQPLRLSLLRGEGVSRV